MCVCVCVCVCVCMHVRMCAHEKSILGIDNFVEKERLSLSALKYLSEHVVDVKRMLLNRHDAAQGLWSGPLVG